MTDHPKRDTAIVVAVIGVIGSILTVVVASILNNPNSSDPAPQAAEPAASSECEPSCEVSVHGNEVWTPTDVVLAPGDRVEITARGSIRHDVTNVGSEVGPEGDLDLGGDYIKPQVGVHVYPPHHGGLIGKIGADGVAFDVGDYVIHTAEVDGRLFLGINDYGGGNPEAGVMNNDGEFTARIEVTQAS